jgi:hypothetical protein
MAPFLPPPLISVFLVLAPVIYWFCSQYAYSIIILYAHAFTLSIWLCSVAEIRLLCQQLLGFTPGKSRTSSDNGMYGLQHTLYNVHLVPETFWFNMGYWDNNTETFAQACRALVRKVMTQMGSHHHSSRILGNANIRSLCKSLFVCREVNNSVIDVGFGCGDSCFMLAEGYNYQVTVRH